MSRSSEEEDGHRPGDPDVPDDDLQQVFMAADDEEEKDRSLPGMLETSWSVQQGMTNQQVYFTNFDHFCVVSPVASCQVSVGTNWIESWEAHGTCVELIKFDPG